MFIRAFPAHPTSSGAVRIPGVNRSIRPGARLESAVAPAHLGIDSHGGAIVLQEAIEVMSDDTADTLAARILAIEHRLYPRAIAELLTPGWRIEGRRFVR